MVYTHTHMKFNLHGHSSQKDPEFPPRLYPEATHTICSWLLSLFPQMHAHTYTYTQEKRSYR